MRTLPGLLPSAYETEAGVVTSDVDTGGSGLVAHIIADTLTATTFRVRCFSNTGTQAASTAVTFSAIMSE